MNYTVHISEKMIQVNEILVDACVGVNHCLSQVGRNLVAEVPKKYCEQAVSALKKHFEDAVLIQKAYPMIEDLHDFILIKPLISEAPLASAEGIMIPGLEKRLVDQASDKEYRNLSDHEIQKSIQQAFELYSINTSKLLRYAGRKGKMEEMKTRLARLDRSRIEKVKALQDYFISSPVEKAWIFGSYSRMEENENSDIDIFVSLEEKTHMGLFALSSMALDLERLLGKNVDLIEEKAVKPFAAESVKRDRILIYERA